MLVIPTSSGSVERSFSLQKKVHTAEKFSFRSKLKQDYDGQMVYIDRYDEE